MARITVITPALPTRMHLLGECLRSVAAQEYQPYEHLVALDYAREGPCVIRNRLAAAARGEWLAFLDDDDLLLSNHLRELLEHSAAEADVVYSFCRVEGRIEMPGWIPNSTFDADRLRADNFIPVTCAVRKSSFERADGFRKEDGQEDWGLWLRLLNSGARFKCVPIVTWIYRFHGGNRTYQGVGGFNPYAPHEPVTLELAETLESLMQRYPNHFVLAESEKDLNRYKLTGNFPAGSTIRLVKKADGHAY
jgi:glycosyltransferase involved in cell wall biosynthesis